MLVVSHNNLHAVAKTEATRVVIYDSARNPISVAVAISPDTVVVSCLGQPDFKEILASLGIACTVVVDTVSHKSSDQLKLII